MQRQAFDHNINQAEKPQEPIRTKTQVAFQL